jgi:2-keto-4-pentenoate hydratase
MTSGVSRDALGPGIRPFGHILKSRVYPSGAHIERARIRRLGLETELCFTMAKTLGGTDVVSEDVRGAVSSVAPAFEINEDRLHGKIDAAVRVADNLKHWGIVVGPDVAPVPPLDWGGVVSTILFDGKLLESVQGRGHIDDHFQSIAALARELSRFGLRIEPGHLVITGSYTRQTIEGLGTYRGTFGALGEVSVDVS